MRILLVEDDSSLAEVFTEVLQDQLYVVDLVADGKTAWVQARLLDYDLIILDVMLPKLDGISLCKQLRERGDRTPVLMLTACNTTTDKVNGLDAGADDYMVKPVDLLEFLARVRALLRRINPQSSVTLDWGELHLDPSTYDVTYKRQPLHLTPKEYSLLELLLRNGRRVLSRSAIVEHLWSLDNSPEEETVKAHIKTLRHKLRSAGAPSDIIETVRSVGYRLKQL